MPHRFLAFLTTALALTSCRLFAADADSNSAAVKARFANPPREYASAPLWTWNDMLTEEQIRSTLRDLAGQKVKQAFVHPRPGLMTPYLSKDWFRLWKVALDEAQRLDMNIWIYDENSYPSGFAGGLVPEAMPESRGRGLHVAEVKQPRKLGEDVFAVYRLTKDGYENVSRQAKAGEKLPDGKYLLATWRLAPEGGWFGGKYYVDLLKPGVTEKFIKITFDAYKRELGEHFGKRMPGIFTDEPHLCPAGGLHWNGHLAEEFQKRWGYRLEDHLPALVRPLGDWKKVRHNYHQVLLEQFIEHWGKPCHDFCEKNGLEFTGHYWEHGWPGTSHGPDNMAMYAWHQRPAIDCLMNRYDEGVHAQFGNVRAVKELSSVANQLGRRRTLCEAYGAGGWDLRFEDMKRIGDWLYVLGVNTMDEHLSYVTIRGARKRDHPQSFSYHEPWWEDYHVMAEYFTRLSVAMSAGKEINGVLVIEPTTTAWMYQTDRQKLDEIGSSFQKLVTDLAKAQVEFDLGCEDIIARHGAVGSREGPDDLPTYLLVGERQYDVVVLPPGMENLNKRTWGKLELFARGGGKLICCGPPPSHVDGKPAEAPLAANTKTFERIDRAALTARLADLVQDKVMIWRTVSKGRLTDPGQDGVAISEKVPDANLLFHHRRRLEDGEILFLVNTSIDTPAAGTVEVESAKNAVEQWDPATGHVAAYPSRRTDKGISSDFDLAPCGSLLLFLSDKRLEPSPPSRAEEITFIPDEPEVRRLGPNVLTLDYVDITAGGKTQRGLYFYRANQMAWQAAGMERNPWDSSVQLHDQLITKKFPPESGFEATYRFTVEGPVPKGLEIVIERPDLYKMTCNGQPVKAKEGAWWLDKAFGRIDITAAAKTGENAVTIKAQPMTIYHELEPAYVLGDFSLKPAESGFVIVPPRPLALEAPSDAHSIQPDGTMWLSGGIGYRTQDPSKSPGDGDPELVFDLGAPRSLAAIKVWNYNEVNLTGRGVKGLKVLLSATGKEGSFREAGSFELDQAASGSTGPSSKPRFPQVLEVKAPGTRFVKLDILSNHRGVTYPTDKPGEDNAFVGLSEVEFLAEGEAGRLLPLDGVRLARASSELAAGTIHNRRAAYLLDGSGMETAGWNQQGHPFYAAGVAYTEEFDVPEPKGRFRVRLPSWYGSVARVSVNGKPAGRIAWQPWECDVTKLIRPGTNSVEVTVIGTLKNTLGPHHAGRMRGAAWPHAFRQGPEHGPPPGANYDTIGYGLFEPFVLEHTEKLGTR